MRNLLMALVVGLAPSTGTRAQEPVPIPPLEPVPVPVLIPPAVPAPNPQPAPPPVPLVPSTVMTGFTAPPCGAVDWIQVVVTYATLPLNTTVAIDAAKSDGTIVATDSVVRSGSGTVTLSVLVPKTFVGYVWMYTPGGTTRGGHNYYVGSGVD
mgnify:CR=1 FL=1